jgi:hypothetical protein
MHLGKKYVCIHASQSRATYVGSTNSLQVPCKFPASSLHLRASRVSDLSATHSVAEKSATRMHLVHVPRIPPWTSATHLQRRKINNADASQMQLTCS